MPDTSKDLIDIKSMTLPELTGFVTELGEKPFRGRQLYEWLHVRLASSFGEMTNLSKDLRSKLSQKALLVSAIPVEIFTSQIDGTQKYLFSLPDGNVIESVLMRYHHGNSVCISSQVGCAMGCRFCASTIGGKVRSLRASEMLEQIYRIQALSGERVSNVVVMGTGEPLDNYDNLIRFIRLLTDENGLHISQRSVTVSTCGLIDKIMLLAQEKLQITLALSLHAVTQEKREKLMPIAKRYPMDRLLEACREYFQVTGRRVTLEYSLVKGENDSPEDAALLGQIASGMHCHVNLIPVNPVKERSFRRPDHSHVEAFRNRVALSGVSVTVRREMGADISGACGQLRRGYLDEKKNTIDNAGPGSVTAGGAGSKEIDA